MDREALLEVLTDFLKANNLKVDWEGIESAPNEALVNALAMMSPYGPAEKQAMLEAPDLKTRAEILIAVTEMDLAKKRTSGDTAAAVRRPLPGSCASVGFGASILTHSPSGRHGRA